MLCYFLILKLSRFATCVSDKSRENTVKVSTEKLSCFHSEFSFTFEKNKSIETFVWETSDSSGMRTCCMGKLLNVSILARHLDIYVFDCMWPTDSDFYFQMIVQRFILKNIFPHLTRVVIDHCRTLNIERDLIVWHIAEALRIVWCLMANQQMSCQKIASNETEKLAVQQENHFESFVQNTTLN